HLHLLFFSTRRSSDLYSIFYCTSCFSSGKGNFCHRGGFSIYIFRIKVFICKVFISMPLQLLCYLKHFLLCLAFCRFSCLCLIGRSEEHTSELQSRENL